MKLARWTHEGRDAYGVIEGGRAYGVSAGFAARHPDLADALDDVAALCTDAMSGAGVAVDGIDWRLPVAPTARIICVGINYPKRYPLDPAQGRPENIILFAKLDGTLVPHGARLLMPDGEAAHSFDYEGEIGVVIGRAADRVSVAQAMDHVAGYTALNDGSVRAWQKHSVHAGKNFARSGGCGPWIATADEVPDPDALRLVTRLNGEVVQDTLARAMFYDMAQVISYISHMMPLRPGDLIATGSPEGTGGSQTPPRFLVRGDVVEVEVEGVATVTTPVG